MAIALNPRKALIFRIVHIDNVDWLLRNGIHCRNTGMEDPEHRQIGDLELIGKRALRQVPVDPGGSLNDYIPFYFTPCSIMLYNIVTGYRGISRVRRQDVVFIVSSLHKLEAIGVKFLFTNEHAYQEFAEFSGDLDRLADMVDWDLIRRKDFSKDPEDPGKSGRYQAEALVFKTLPLEAILGFACYNDVAKENLESVLDSCGHSFTVKVTGNWYFGHD